VSSTFSKVTGRVLGRVARVHGVVVYFVPPADARDTRSWRTKYECAVVRAEEATK
jgi:hypothetical protein